MNQRKENKSQKEPHFKKNRKLHIIVHYKLHFITNYIPLQRSSSASVDTITKRLTRSWNKKKRRELKN